MIAAQSFQGPSMPSALTLDQIPATGLPMFVSMSSTDAMSLASTLQVDANSQVGNLDELSSLAQPLQSTASLATTTSYNVVDLPEQAQPPSTQSSDLDVDPEGRDI